MENNKQGSSADSAGLLRFRQAKAKEIDYLLSQKMPQPFKGERKSFRHSLISGRRSRGLAVIAEYKRASPSLGDINLGFTAAQASAAYSQSDAISVLTEEQYFKGHLSYIGQLAESARPILRKDFIFHHQQVHQTAASAASAMLLIVSLTPDVKELKDLRLLAQEFGIEAVVEVYSPQELELARQSGASLIQVNARNLETLKVDSKACALFISENPPLDGEDWIAASGLSKPSDFQLVRQSGYTAALVGTALMKSNDPGQALKSILTSLSENQ
jgi:indole-3-glycerol phosphate synthase